MATEKINNASDISSELWKMANNLRGGMDASEFKNYILGFMFYRYLSENQEEYLKNSGILPVEGDQTINEAYDEVPTDEVNDYLEAEAETLGYAIAPQYTWNTLVNKINNSDIAPSYYQDMFDDFNKNAHINKNAEQDFSGIFADVNLNNSHLGGTSAASKARSLNEVVKLVDKFDYTDDNGHDILGDVYEYLIAKFASNSGKKAGEFYTPHEVSEVLARIVTDNKDINADSFSVYDPTMGSGSLLLTVQDALKQHDYDGRVVFYGQELNSTTYNLARMNLMMHGVEYQNMTLRNGDTLESDWPDGMDANGIDHPRNFDAVVVNPPYSQSWDNKDTKMKDPRFKDYGRLAPKSKADFAFLLHGLYHLSDTGKMAIVLPHGVLFRGGAEGAIRKALINKNYLDAVIGLPAKLFYSTSIPTTILVFSKHKTAKDIFFIDASNEYGQGKNQNYLREADIDKIIDTLNKREDVDKYAHDASIDEIQDNDYNLNIPRYVDTYEPEAPVDVDKLVKDVNETNEEIDQLGSEISDMLDDLVGEDADAQAKLEKIKGMFK